MRPPSLIAFFYEAADCVKPLRFFTSVETSLSERLSPRARAIVVIAISAWKTASAVILLFVLFDGDISSPAHHDKRGVGHNLFNDRPRVGSLAVLATPSDGYTTQSSLPNDRHRHRCRDLKVGAIAPHRIQDARQSPRESDDGNPTAAARGQCLCPRA